MRIISIGKINAYSSSHKDADIALRDWYKRCKKAEWNNFADLKKDFRSADYVGNKRFVFNIKGNHYRLVAIILFQIQTVYIRFIGTHTDYKIDYKNI